MFRCIPCGRVPLSVLLLAAAPVHATQHRLAQCMIDVRYEVIELTDEPERWTEARDVNDHGQVTGDGDFPNDRRSAFAWDCRNGLRALDEAGAAQLSVGRLINNRGQIAGYLSRDEMTTQPYLWTARTGFRELTSESSSPYQLNDWADVALGTAPPSRWSPRAGLQTFSEITGIDFLGTPVINNLRTIGGVRLASQASTFVIWNAKTGLRTVAPVPADSYVEVAAMNDRSDIVGRISTQSGTVPYILKHNGELQLLADPASVATSAVADINNSREVTGSLHGAGATVAFVWDPLRGLRYMSDLTPNDASVPREFNVHGINNWGWIAGAVRSPDFHWMRSALFVPVPRNSTSFRNLSRLKGERLCRALDAVKLNMMLSCRRASHRAGDAEVRE